ncbi:hypothetical protein LBMAG53_34040 [Planctomycetota bacterium]|nr:hypothetical protein LBMAG53_34040 [Planctomycetota bacterium]
MWLWIDRGALAGIALAVALMVQPWWSDGLRWGFFLAIAAVIVQTVSSRMASK